ncbi:MAG: D-alanine--D-alanine ligase [Alphaproteobacteria bacterium]
MNASPLHVAVVMGGISAEQEVSRVSGAACVTALETAGYKVSQIDAWGDALMAALGEVQPDVVFNALHGRYGEDGVVQGVFETLGLPYTHSGVFASAAAMDKVKARQIFSMSGLRCAEGRVASREEVLAQDPMEPPYVVKPIAEGSSFGVAIVHSSDNRPRSLLAEESWTFGEEVLVEKFVPGRELSVAVMDGEALGVAEIETDRAFYDYDAKYADGGSRHTVPADISAEVEAEARAIAETAHKVLGCRGVTRSDIRFDEAGELSNGKPTQYLLEINTQPGMTPTSLVPEIAAMRGLSFEKLVSWMVEDASCQR